MDESLLKLLTIVIALAGSWATVKATLSSHTKTIEKLEEALAGHERRLTIQETTTTLSNGNLQQAIGCVEGQVSALHKRLDNALGARPPREGDER